MTLPAASSVLPATPAYDPAAMRYQADPLADATIAAIVGSWELPAGEANLQTLLALNADRMRHLQTATMLLNTWTNNAALVDWSPPDGTSPHIVEALRGYLDAGRGLPEWCDPAKITRGENVFTEHGPLSVMSLFCASLPDCYIQPKAAAVLQISGQLTTNADYRIRSTAAMVFPVMLRGGLTTPEGLGVAQTLKVRLIHATIRNLMLHGAPQAMVNAVVQPIATPAAEASQQSMHGAFMANGWNVSRDGLPNNQEQLVFTLLTFHFVFLRAMRTLGIGLSAMDEEAYLHCWNVVGFLLGIEPKWMPFTYADAERLFLDIQTQCLADNVYPGGTDARPALGGALMDYMSDSIPFKLLKPLPALFTRYLCGGVVADALGISNRQPLISRILFAVLMSVSRLIDSVVRLVVPQFSLSRMFSRVVGYHLLTSFLMDQTRPLKLPTQLLTQMHATVGTWDDDAKAPRWLNRLEDRLTVRGRWGRHDQ
ncbi:DUF2236 domain-containing protein [Acidovorax sp. D2M1]|uniref:DUF2236 domain-containing protein n=1 Tax=Acidovorax benzenivorans TaxID=2987520 RepID=A0ABT5S1B3_9BURK|nr:oxygenase MpaB family protein [Acidovorax benzenivorans]MDD2178913.1 DUF2236 domain-containing protein [Acidovorax benzenivorans]